MNWFNPPWRTEEKKHCIHCKHTINEMLSRPVAQGEMVPVWNEVKDCLPNSDREVMIILREHQGYNNYKSVCARRVSSSTFNPGSGWVHREVIAWRDYTDREKELLKEKR